MYKNCQDALDAGHTTSGVYIIIPDGVNEIAVYCEQEADGGGWTVSQSIFIYLITLYIKWH